MSDEIFGTGGGGAIFASIVKNKIAYRVDETEATQNGQIKPNYRKRKLEKGINAGTEVYERVFDFMTGRITKIDKKTGEYGVSLLVTVENGGTTVILDIPLLNQDGTVTIPAGSLADQFALVDFDQDLKLGLFVKEGQVKSVFIEQNGVYIPSTKKNPAFEKHIQSKPRAEKKVDEFTGAEKWDWTEPSKWQKQQVVNAINYFVEKGVGNEPQSTPAPTPTPAPQQEAVGADGDTIKDDDLPF